jgi:hypothetical protein
MQVTWLPLVVQSPEAALARPAGATATSRASPAAAGTARRNPGDRRVKRLGRCIGCSLPGYAMPEQETAARRWLSPEVSLSLCAILRIGQCAVSRRRVRPSGSGTLVNSVFSLRSPAAGTEGAVMTPARPEAATRAPSRAEATEGYRRHHRRRVDHESLAICSTGTPVKGRQRAAVRGRGRG